MQLDLLEHMMHGQHGTATMYCQQSMEEYGLTTRIMADRVFEQKP